MAGTTDLQRLVVTLEANLAKYNKEMLKAQQSTDKTTREIEQKFKRAEGVLRNFGRGFIQAAIGQATLSGLKGLIDSVGELADEAKRAGISAEQLQKFGVAAERSGSSMAAVVDLMKKFNLEIGQAATAGGPLANLLAANGVALRDQTGNIRNNVDLFNDMVDLIKNARTPQERMVIAQLAFGKAAADSIDFLQQGSAAITQIGVEAEKAGGIIQEKLVDSADRLSDKWSEEWKRFKNEGAASILYVIDKMDQLQSQLDREFRPVRRILGTVTPSDLAGPDFEKTGRQGGPPPKATVIPPTGGGKKPSPIAAPFVEARPDIDRFIEQMDDARDTTREFVGELVHGLREGAKLTDVLSAAFGRLADKMIDRLLDQGIDALFGGRGAQSTDILGQALGLAAPGMSSLGISRNPFDMQRANKTEWDWTSSRQIGGRGPHLTDPPMGSALGSFAGIEGAAEMLPPRSLAPISGAPYSDMINAAAKRNGISPSLLAGLIKQESQFDPNATSSAGAMGLTQLMPGTAKELGVLDPYDPFQSINGGADYLSKMLKMSGGDTPSALARYNWGPGNFAKKGGLSNLPDETQTYIANVTKYEKQFADSLKSVATTAETASTGFADSFAPALKSVLGAVGGATGGMGGIVGGLGSLATMFAGRANGGPISPGRPYLVGERGPEIVMPRVPSLVVPNHKLGGGAGGEVVVHIDKSKYFDAYVERRVAVGGNRTLNTARRSLPDTQARFAKLGTTSR